MKLAITTPLSQKPPARPQSTPAMFGRDDDSKGCEGGRNLARELPPRDFAAELLKDDGE